MLDWFKKLFKRQVSPEGNDKGVTRVMKLVAGLGNPGKQYADTRHNLGFMVLDQLGRDMGFDFSNSTKFKAEIGEKRDRTEGKLLFLKPQTYMNLSGESIGKVARFYQLDADDILIIYDDVDLPVGKIRFAQKGQSGGHRGIKSVIDCVGSAAFHRLKIGIGRPKIVQKETADHVLEAFDAEELKAIDEAIKLSSEAIQMYLRRGMRAAMNQYNSGKEKRQVD